MDQIDQNAAALQRKMNDEKSELSLGVSKLGAQDVPNIMGDVNHNRVGWQCMMDDVERSLGLAGVEGVIQICENTAFCFFSGKRSVGHGESKNEETTFGEAVRVEIFLVSCCGSCWSRRRTLWWLQLCWKVCDSKIVAGGMSV